MPDQSDVIVESTFIPPQLDDNWPFALLLLFKDKLEQTAGSPFHHAAESSTVQAHRDAGESDIIVPGNETLALFPELPPIWPAELTPGKIPHSTCAWGWWRKTWEYHTVLLRDLQNACSNGSAPQVLLYSQYAHILYVATLRDVYFRPYLSTCSVPPDWTAQCPEYYRTTKYLCGAFFALTLGKAVPNPTAFLERYAIDPQTFPFRTRFPRHPPVSLPADTRSHCSKAIFNTPTRALLRSTDHTLFVLSARRAPEQLHALVSDPDTPDLDSRLAAAIQNTQWLDVRTWLNATGPAEWSHLAKLPKSLLAIATIASRAGSRITRFDLFLFASILSGDAGTELLTTTHSSFSELGTALRKWLLALNPADLREAAAEVFSTGWKCAANRYDLDPNAEYFTKLDSIESIIGTAKFNIAHKFYRDHLSHNVRCGLLAAHLASQYVTLQPFATPPGNSGNSPVKA